MTIDLGEIETIFRYPVKSMAGETMETASLGWNGIDGDRRLAFRRTREHGGFPWLTASKLPELVRFTPVRRQQDGGPELPTHIRTPEGNELPVFGEALAMEIARRHGSPVEMTHLRSGIFDDAMVSVIADGTVHEIARLAGNEPDVRRFRPNIVIRLVRPDAFQEGGWRGGVLAFGDPASGPRVSVTMHDVRCSMVNIDPDSGQSTPEVLKAVVRANQNNAGVYGTVIRAGQLARGQAVRLEPFPPES